MASIDRYHQPLGSHSATTRPPLSVVASTFTPRGGFKSSALKNVVLFAMRPKCDSSHELAQFQLFKIGSISFDSQLIVAATCGVLNFRFGARHVPVAGLGGLVVRAVWVGATWVTCESPPHTQETCVPHSIHVGKL